MGVKDLLSRGSVQYARFSYDFMGLRIRLNVNIQVVDLMNLLYRTKQWSSRTIALLLTIVTLVIVLTTGTTAVEARTNPSAAFPVIAYNRLPAEAQQTIVLIQKGGPFPYPQKDGTVFGNFERRLPRAARGYYREYTVPTPGLRHRGARRIVTGSQQEYYYTGDHYKSFALVQSLR
jgi:ribonuclease T1